jgi:hypothetical protein
MVGCPHLKRLLTHFISHQKFCFEDFYNVLENVQYVLKTDQMTCLYVFFICYYHTCMVFNVRHGYWWTKKHNAKTSSTCFVVKLPARKWSKTYGESRGTIWLVADLSTVLKEWWGSLFGRFTPMKIPFSPTPGISKRARDVLQGLWVVMDKRKSVVLSEINPQVCTPQPNSSQRKYFMYRVWRKLFPGL